MTVRREAGIAALGPEWDPVFAAAPGIQSRRAWFEAIEAAALPPGARPLWLALRRDGDPAGLLPLMQAADGAVSSLTSPYTVLYQPLLAPGTDPFAAGRAFGRALRRHASTRLEALDPAWPGFAPLMAGLGRAGLVRLGFDHFGNWHEDVGGLGWEGYLAARPGPLRSTVKRRVRAAARMAGVRHEIVRAPDQVAAALAAYEAIYARSWKEPEPFPGFNAALLPRLARAGALRLAVLWRDDVPLAAQYWTVDAGVGTVLKLAHDEAEKALSPGTVLTAAVIEALLAEGVQALDFGRGDDPYKKDWVRQRRQRVGVVLAAPWRVQGAAAVARHWLGGLRRKLVRSADP